MSVTNAFALKKLICEAPRSCNEQADGAQNFRVPVYELIENIENDMTEGTAVIDRGLPALRAVMADELCTAILAVRQHSMRIFGSTEPAPARRSLDRGNRCVAEDNFCRFIGHISDEVTKGFSLRRLHRNSRPVD